MKYKSFLTPLAIIRIEGFYDLKNNKIYEDNRFSNIIFATDVEGNKFFLNLKTNLQDKEVNEEFVKWYFEEKSNNNIKQDFVLKIEKYLSEDENILDEIDNYVEKNNLNKREARNYEKEFLENKSKELAFNNKLIKKGSIIRLPISYSSNKNIKYNNIEYPLYDSLCLITSVDNSGNIKPSISGTFYIGQSRHELPILLKTNKKDNNKLNILFNNKLANIDYINTLFNHSVRTVEKTAGFFLYFVYKGNIKKFKSIIENLNSPNKNVESYLENLQLLKDELNNDLNLLKEIEIYLPLNLDKNNLLNDTEVLFNKIPNAVTNISLSTQYTTIEEKNELIKNIEDELEYIIKNKVTLYGIYSILSLTNEIESDTYGFLNNNIKKHSICLSLNDTLDLIDKFKIKRDIDLEDNNYNKELELKNNNGILEF